MFHSSQILHFARTENRSTIACSEMQRKRIGTTSLPFKMPLYPIPVVLAILMWLFVFYATGLAIILSFAVVLMSGIVVYLVKAKIKNEWPFQNILYTKDTTNSH